MVSRDCNEVVKALAALDVKPQWVGLVAKDMIHPRYIDPLEFKALGVKDQGFLERT